MIEATRTQTKKASHIQQRASMQSAGDVNLNTGLCVNKCGHCSMLMNTARRSEGKELYEAWWLMSADPTN